MQFKNVAFKKKIHLYCNVNNKAPENKPTEEMSRNVLEKNVKTSLKDVRQVMSAC